jgi:hypothetical protein
MTLGFTQPLAETTTRNIPGELLAHKADSLTAISDPNV